MNRKNKFLVSTSLDFMVGLGRLPRKSQKKAKEFLIKLQNNPFASDFNFEKIERGVDSSMRSLRVDDNYRAIASCQENGVFVLLWIDKHDEADRWARTRRLAINPATGGVQLLKIEEKTLEPREKVAVKPSRVGMFDAFSDETLLKIGTPGELLPDVRAVVSESELDALEEDFPQVAYFRLFLLACGSTVDQVLAEIPTETQVDASDFGKALETPESLAQFKTFRNEEELLRALNAPLETWRVFLHPTQRDLVEKEFNGPVRVLGSAGTGKTVVAVHRANYLASAVHTRPDDRILFTTFTKNLADDARGLLESICEPGVLKRIETINLSAWAARYVRKQGYASLDADARIDADKIDAIWKQALNFKPDAFSDAFFKDEYRQVLQPQHVTSVEEYYRASRVGRGRRLSRKERREIWPVFEEFRALKAEARVKDFEDLYYDAYCLLGDERNRTFEYQAIIVDETQDLSLNAWRMLRRMIAPGKNDLFLVGDARQRIYGYQSSLGEAGIDIRGRGRKLRVNYRTTKQIYRFASNVLENVPFDDLDDGEDANDKCLSLRNGAEPEVHIFKDKDEERRRIVELLKKIETLNKEENPDNLKNVCVVCRTKTLCDEYEAFFKARNIDVVKIENERTYRNDQPGVRVATMHRVKGLEFDYVIIASACREIIPLKSLLDAQDSETERAAMEKMERSLFYVALTRARKAAFITGYGAPSLFVEQDGQPRLSEARIKQPTSANRADGQPRLSEARIKQPTSANRADGRSRLSEARITLPINNEQTGNRAVV